MAILRPGRQGRRARQQGLPLSRRPLLCPHLHRGCAKAGAPAAASLCLCRHESGYLQLQLRSVQSLTRHVLPDPIDGRRDAAGASL